MSPEGAMLVVDEGLKGASHDDRFAVNNRSAPAVLCSSYDAPLPPNEPRNGRFRTGDRALVFLSNEAGGLWRPAMNGSAVFGAPRDDLEPLAVDWSSAASLTHLELGAMLSSIPPIARLPVDLQLEANEPCNPHWFDRQSIPRYAADSTFAGLITVQSNADGVITARVDRTVRGDLRPQALVRLNGHGFHQESSCRPVMEAPAYYRAGQHLLVFLRPDDYGVADYRLSEWGTAAVEVNDRYLTFGAPTLDLVRNALGLGVSERDTEKSSGHFALAWRLSLVVAGSLAAASAALWFASRRSF